MPAPARGRARGRGGAKLPVPAKPTKAELPSNLHVAPSNDGIPPAIVDALPEFSKLQPFFSALEKLMPGMESSLDTYTRCWFGSEGIQKLERPNNNTYSAVLHLHDRVDNIFVKRIHLLEPIAAMQGTYIWPEDGALPAPSERWREALEKINNPYNEAYVDSIFAMCASKLVEGGYSPGWCRCYGTFVARAEKYLYNVSDEISSMRTKPWWNRNRRLGIFRLATEEEEPTTQQEGFREGLTDLDMSDFIDVEDQGHETLPTESHADQEHSSSSDLEQETEPVPDDESNPVQLATPKLRLRRMTRSNGSESSCSEYQQFVEFANFPVQVTLLEHAEGTMDSLIDEENSEDFEDSETKDLRWSSWLFQVVAALMVAQHWYGFVHNDLHTNNVMWTSTDEEFLYYKIQKGTTVFYKRVPTYRKIMKIIDFGRSSYTLPEPAGFMISDAFFPGNDASDQYNCEPFYDSKAGKKIEPNPSFDLCRLSVSLIESLFLERPDAKQPVRIMSREQNGTKLYTETVSPVYNLLWSWLQDDSGKNVLRNPDGTERYPDFDLYKAIAAHVHHAIPKQQIEKPIFAQYTCKQSDIPEGVPIYDLFL
jgi:hypothetical protein